MNVIKTTNGCYCCSYSVEEDTDTPSPTPSTPLPIPNSEREGGKEDLLTRLHCLYVVLTRTYWVGDKAHNSIGVSGKEKLLNWSRVEVVTALVRPDLGHRVATRGTEIRCTRLGRTRSKVRLL